MKIALTKGTLKVPPTYFAVSHALEMLHQPGNDISFEFFTLAASIQDSLPGLKVREFTPFRGLPFAQRERLLPVALLPMSRAVSSYSPDVIHQHFASWAWPATQAAIRTGTPLMMTLHGSDVRLLGSTRNSPMYRYQRRTIAQAASVSSLLLPVSKYLAGLARDFGFPAEKLAVHYQGIDTDYFTPGEASGESSDRPRLVFAGTLNRQKGIDQLLRASVELSSRLPHDLIIIGRGPLEEEVGRIAREHPHISPLGQVDRARLRDELRKATVLAFPSTEDRGTREAAGLVPLEAQACGVPVVAYRSGGVPEMISPDAGLLIAENDGDALALGLSRLLTEDRAAHEQRGRAARDFVVRNRSLSESVRELEEHYRSLASAS
ncbi:glycosyltransferase family 4 protein [Arthrobacter sp. RAF14]|uniref:glycosyltransferase family 4 protein n=1 Tax=Arthrobacter sp. RAF14 TaxID=3233051 RepID=UPI003F8FF9BB